MQIDYAPLNCPSLLSINDESNNINVVTNWDTEFFNYTLLPFKHYELNVYVRNLRNEIQNELQISICKNLYYNNNNTVTLSFSYLPCSESSFKIIW